MTTFKHSARPLRQYGLTLVELMIAMVLGLLVTGGAISIVIANGQTNRTNIALSQIQESSRTAFELLARDIRQAGATGCGNLADQIDASGLNGNTDPMLAVPWTGIRGYAANTAAPGVTTGSDAGNRVAGTDAILVQSVSGGGFLLVDVDSEATSQNEDGEDDAWKRSYEFHAPANAISDGNLLLACNSGGAVIFQASNVSSSGTTVTAWDDADGAFFNTADSGMVSRLNNVLWYIGNNGRPEEGGRSLYRRLLGGNAEEIIPGVSDMEILYRDGEADDFASAPGNWGGITAVQIILTTDSLDARVGVDDGRLQRSFTSLIGLRNPRI
ncbi:MAG TPA: prepilin-type N-terminal cleavage/methylation domain-containing protein [Azoarcus sp.]|nr:prepilin-type N-terminal cleavage/methylation domain-containing protein [Azoarcus sp.]